ncbi:MAG: hypothetical protein P1S59_06590 [bacterium]|nr:hypothetical protein [bacterium]
MVEVVPAVSLTDNCSTEVKWSIESIVMNEGDSENTFDPLYDSDSLNGNTEGDMVVADGRIYLRAERKGGSIDGRVYTLTLSATDDAGNVTYAQTRVTVPHDQR